MWRGPNLSITSKPFIVASQELVETLFMCCRLAQILFFINVYCVFHLCLDNTNIQALYGITNHRIQPRPESVSVEEIKVPCLVNHYQCDANRLYAWQTLCH